MQSAGMELATSTSHKSPRALGRGSEHEAVLATEMGYKNSLWGPDTLAAQRTVSSVVRKESTGNKNHREVSALGWAGLSGGAAGPQQGSPRTTQHTEQ